MRLYSRTGATRLDDPEYGTFDADEQGGFDFPDDVSDRLHSFHVGGKPLWETDVERQQRLIAEELERRKDPATLYSAVEQLVRAANATAALHASAATTTDAVKQLNATLETPPPAEEPAAAQAPAEEPAAPKRTRRSKTAE